MPDKPTFGRYSEIPYEQMTPEQQKASTDEWFPNYLSHGYSLYIGYVCRAEENWVRQLEYSRAERGRRKAGREAPQYAEQNPDGRRSRAQASSD